MLVIVGYVVVLASVFGGFAMAGGHLGSLFQPIELLMIGGGALGAMLVSSGPKALKATLKALPSIFKGSKYNKALYLELLALLFEILARDAHDGHRRRADALRDGPQVEQGDGHGLRNPVEHEVPPGRD